MDKTYGLGMQGNACTAAAPPSASGLVLSRLSDLFRHTIENQSVASHLADKIVGSVPTSQGANGQTKPDRIATSFIESLEAMLGDLERCAAETREHLDRLNRAF